MGQRLVLGCLAALLVLGGCVTTSSKQIDGNHVELTVTGNGNRVRILERTATEFCGLQEKGHRLEGFEDGPDTTKATVVCFTEAEEEEERAVEEAERQKAAQKTEAKQKEVPLLAGALKRCQGGGSKKACLAVGDKATYLDEPVVAIKAYVAACNVPPLELSSCRKALSLADEKGDRAAAFVANTMLCRQLEGIACGALYLFSLSDTPSAAPSPEQASEQRERMLTLAAGLLVKECDAAVDESCAYIATFASKCERTLMVCKDIGLYSHKHSHDVQLASDEEKRHSQEHGDLVQAQRQTLQEP